jgi:hypothetical protein
MRSRTRTFVLLVLALPTIARAQSIAQRVHDARTATVELHYSARPGVCGDGSHYWNIGRSMHVGEDVVVHGDQSRYCVPGPVRVRLRTEDGRTQVLHVDVGPLPSAIASDVTDLGAVSATAAADYFLGLAEAERAGASSRAITAAVLADSASVWRRLLGIARDSGSRARSTRHEASFWLAQFAAARSEGRGESLDYERDDGHDDPAIAAKVSAIFALSQLRDEQGVEPLLQVARTSHEPRLRRQAIFWLGESGDARALSLFGEILSRS